MTDAQQYKLTYFVYVIGEFANKYGLTDKQAFQYLKRYDGLQALDECYPAEHTLPIEETLSDLTMLCHRNGGGLI
jgi:hypothetical protein